MFIIILLSLLAAFLCFTMLRTRRIAAHQQLQSQPTDLQWRVRYVDGKVSQAFNHEMAEKHRKVFGGKVIRAGGRPGDFRK
jgi:hypothetical protein